MIHGTRSAYTHGCRCTECTTANRLYQFAYRQKTSGPKPFLPVPRFEVTLPVDLPGAVRALRRAYVEAAFQQTSNLSRVAGLLGVSRPYAKKLSDQRNLLLRHAGCDTVRSHAPAQEEGPQEDLEDDDAGQVVEEKGKQDS